MTADAACGLSPTAAAAEDCHDATRHRTGDDAGLGDRRERGGQAGRRARVRPARSTSSVARPVGPREPSGPRSGRGAQALGQKPGRRRVAARRPGHLAEG